MQCGNTLKSNRSESVLVKLTPKTRFSLELVRAKSGKTLSALSASAINFVVGGSFMGDTKVLEIVNNTWHPKRETRIENIKASYPDLFTNEQLEQLK
ncbi:MAG: hypothetical protein ACQ9MH_10650 [Nitrospinales bacterium]